jgi:hypothetical protein
MPLLEYRGMLTPDLRTTMALLPLLLLLLQSYYHCCCCCCCCLLLDHNGIPARAHTDPLDWHIQQVLNTLHIRLQIQTDTTDTVRAMSLVQFCAVCLGAEYSAQCTRQGPPQTPHTKNPPQTIPSPPATPLPPPPTHTHLCCCWQVTPLSCTTDVALPPRQRLIHDLNRPQLFSTPPLSCPVSTPPPAPMLHPFQPPSLSPTPPPTPHDPPPKRTHLRCCWQVAPLPCTTDVTLPSRKCLIHNLN